jgi:hypothetical protein
VRKRTHRTVAAACQLFGIVSGVIGYAIARGASFRGPSIPSAQGFIAAGFQ